MELTNWGLLKNVLEERPTHIIKVVNPPYPMEWHKQCVTETVRGIFMGD